MPMRTVFAAAALLLLLSLTRHPTTSFRTPQPHATAGRRVAGVPTPDAFRPSRVQPWRGGSSARVAPVPPRARGTALMGIPKMFRWLTDQYPNILNRRLGSATSIPGVDNFYLDMNGIIHPCTHGNNDSEITLLDETEMFKKIFGYVDRLYKIVKPRRVLYLAVDGVAPRAKMNQQRSRRFRSSKEAEELAARVLARDGALPERAAFDSNCITPGTDFMLKLSLALRRWVQYKQETDPVWQNGCDVVISGPDVPGEGEHKVRRRAGARGPPREQSHDECLNPATSVCLA